MVLSMPHEKAHPTLLYAQTAVINVNFCGLEAGRYAHGAIQ